MEKVKQLLKQELTNRISKNPSYSLRAFAAHLEMSHSTLSRILSGKRKLSLDFIEHIGRKLNLGPDEMNRLKETNQDDRTQSYFSIQQDAFAAISEWYFDAILELANFKNYDFSAIKIAKSLGISKVQVEHALETLERLDLLLKQKDGKYLSQERNTTNLIDAEFTNAAKKKYQKSILTKSLEALDETPIEQRDHTSMTMGIAASDLPEVKKIIKKFRRDLNSFLQREDVKPDEVYQLQISFFPLTIKKGE